MRKKWIRRLQWLLIIYAGIGILIYYLQDYLMFQPEPFSGSHRYDFRWPHRDLTIPFSKSVSMNVIQFEVPDSLRKGVVLYFHGNKKNIGWYARFVPMFTSRYYEVWMVDYPGFGKSTGVLTESMLYEYAIQLYKLARRRFSESQIIIYGKSMGTGIAAYLAAGRPAERLILETPYYSYTSVARHFIPFYPVEQMIRIKIPTYEYLPRVKVPITIFHGTEDGVIPYSNAGRLKKFLKPGDEFITIEGGSHNDLADFSLFRQKLDSVLLVPQK